MVGLQLLTKIATDKDNENWYMEHARNKNQTKEILYEILKQNMIVIVLSETKKIGEEKKY